MDDWIGLARFATSEGVVAMPLSSEQILTLKQGDTKVSFQIGKSGKTWIQNVGEV